MNNSTTLAISKKDNGRLTKNAKQFAVSKKETITLYLDYFERTGVDPRTGSLPKAELNQLKKRLDFVIGFLKNQETEYIKPALEAIVANEDRMKNNIEQLAMKNDLKIQGELIKVITNRVVSIMQDLVNNDEEILSFQPKILEKLEKIENKKWFKI